MGMCVVEVKYGKFVHLHLRVGIFSTVASMI